MSFLIKYITILIYAAQMRRELVQKTKMDPYRKSTGSQPDDHGKSKKKSDFVIEFNIVEKGMNYRRKVGCLQGNLASSWMVEFQRRLFFSDRPTQNLTFTRV